MKKIAISFLFILSGILSFSQTNSIEGYFVNESFLVRTPNDFFNLQRGNGEAPSSILTEDKVQGSPYLNKDFVLGDVIIDKYKFAGVPLRYNIYNDDIEYQKDNNILAIANPQEVKRIFIGDLAFVYNAYLLSNEKAYGYFQLLNEGKANVLKKHEVSYQMPTAEQAYTPAAPPRFIDLPDKLFVKIGNNPAQKYTNTKKLLVIFGDKKAEMEKYLKKENLNIKKEEDLVKLILFYNSL